MIPVLICRNRQGDSVIDLLRGTPGSDPPDAPDPLTAPIGAPPPLDARCWRVLSRHLLERAPPSYTEASMLK